MTGGALLRYGVYCCDISYCGAGGGTVLVVVT